MTMDVQLPFSHAKNPPTEPSPERALPPVTRNRRYLEEQPYLLPKDGQEMQRLKFQHRMLYTQFHRHFFAPIQPETVHRILDVGCGPGDWLFDLAACFPEAALTGLDSDADSIAQTSTAQHPSCQLLQGDVLQGLPFAQRSFDYTHMRCMILAIPAHQWPFVIQELVRVTAPGGWVELFEGGYDCEPVGPHMQQMLTWGKQVLAQRGFELRVIDPLSAMLRHAGAHHVREQRLTIPIGSWAGRVGALMAKDLLALFETFKASLCQSLSLPVEQVDMVLERLPEEWDRYQTSYTYREVHGHCRERPNEEG